MLAEKQQSELDFYSPLQSLYAQYGSEKEAVIKVSETLDSNAVNYFFEAAYANNYRMSVNATDHDIAEETGVDLCLLISRINRGWGIEDAISVQKMKFGEKRTGL